MAKPAPPQNRVRIRVLDMVLVVGGFLGIMAFNRMSIARLERSLPNANNQIVGEWKSTRGPEHLIFRPDRSLSLIVEVPPEAQPAPTQPPSPPAMSGEPSTQAADTAQTPREAPPIVGKYQLSEAGKIYLQLSNGKKYTTTIQPINRDRFDLIDSDTEGVTTYERVPPSKG
ncbi:MAG TPA: hypothetical protein VME69_16390 [Methylocella sp.]|nr:hypothetical protein [Methylocella sp.]